jgi:hypothetical protein
MFNINSVTMHVSKMVYNYMERFTGKNYFDTNKKRKMSDYFTSL